MFGPICVWETICERMAALHRRSETRSTLWIKENGKCSNIVLPPSLVLVVVCLHGAHILRGEVLSSLVQPDLFTLWACFQFSNTYQKIYYLYIGSTNLHLLILSPALFPNVLSILHMNPVCLTSIFPQLFVTLFSFIFPLSFGFLFVFDRSFNNLCCLSNSCGRPLWELRAMPATTVGVNKATFA